MNNVRKIFKTIIMKTEVTATTYRKIRGMYLKHYLSDIKLIQKKYERKLGRSLNITEPLFYNDKLQWLKLYWDNPLAKVCADKFEVRGYVKDTIGETYLNELYGVYDAVEDININELPDSFVLKATHGSGFNIICKDKKKMDWDKEFKKMRLWLKENYYLYNREWVYRDLMPRIVCEKLLEQGEGAELQDYRFFCFAGEPKFISVDFNITDKKKTRRNLYDLNWELMSQEISYPKELNIKVEKPRKLAEMIALSKILSRDFPHARVDFYYIKERILFGEITFFHQSGMGIIKPEQFEMKMGEWLDLPQGNIREDLNN
ncbi:ATP-grasp fold amidoligase family protein [Paenibacillus sp. FSL R10-2736]|uniref:ATP-grasp fold amidoligase family protein n=1 Tax=Paenibacillus sp. FSL R10-2736 TaxID=2954692 RepID=UPI0030F67D9C